MGDGFALDADGWIGERDILHGELAEERTALAHDDWYQVDGDLVDQPEFEALPSHGSRRARDNAVAGDFLCLRDGGLDAADGEGERSVWMGVDPVGRDLVGDDHDGHVHRVPPAPAVVEVEQRAAADERTELGGPPAPVLGAFRGQVEGDVRSRGRDFHEVPTDWV